MRERRRLQQLAFLRRNRAAAPLAGWSLRRNNKLNPSSSSSSHPRPACPPASIASRLRQRSNGRSRPFIPAGAGGHTLHSQGAGGGKLTREQEKRSER